MRTGLGFVLGLRGAIGFACVLALAGTGRAETDDSTRSPFGIAVATNSFEGVAGLRVDFMVPAECVLYAERLHAKADIGRLVQAIVFRDEASFTRWCDADSVRFAYPLIFSNLRRAGCELLSHCAAGNDA